MSLELEKLELVADLSIPLDFEDQQPTAFGAGPASLAPCDFGDSVGDTRLGGSVNCAEIKLVPHCNGTHTECVGHITDSRIHIIDCLKDVLVPTLLISVEPRRAADCGERIVDRAEPSDAVIARASIAKKFEELSSLWHPNGTIGAVAVRTLPNPRDKVVRNYDEELPPYFTSDAIEFLVENRIDHLLCDVPSIDRMHDGGQLANHRIFWNLRPSSRESDESTRINATITELIFAPNDVPDGHYLLNLQIGPFCLDVSPSRPLLLTCKKQGPGKRRTLQKNDITKPI
ncbi:MAG: cyclase family protein [Pyrinomonadaceae bacterium]